MSMLRIKLPIVIVILVTFSILATGLLTYTFSSQLLLRKSENEIRGYAFRAGETIHSMVVSSMREAEILAAQEVFRETLTARKRMDDASYFVSGDKWFESATSALRRAFAGTTNHEKYWLGDEQGVVIASSEEQPERGNIRISDRPYFMEAMKGRSAVSGTITSRANGLTIMVTAAPIRDESGQVIGVLGNSIYTSLFSQQLRGIKVNTRGQLYIMDSDGLILAHSTDESRVQTYVENREILKLLEDKPADQVVKGTMEITDGGVQKYVGYSKIPLANWIVIVEDDIEDIQSPLKELEAKFVLALSAAILISLLLFPAILSRWVTKPLDNIVGTMALVGQGNLNARVRLDTKDEFGIISRSLNQMLARIQELISAQDQAAQLELQYVSERERSRLSDLLTKAMGKLSSTLNGDQVRRLAAEELQAIVPYHGLTIWWYEHNELTLVSENVMGDHAPYADAVTALAYYQFFLSDPQPLLASPSDRQGYSLAVPLLYQGKVNGLTILERKDRRFSKGEAELLLTYAIQVMIAYTNAGLYQTMETMAITDELTGLHNRRHFYRLAQQTFERTEGSGKPLSAILFDIDYFKHINDRYGHQAGDDILRRFSQVLLSQPLLSSGAILSRLGGEEFAMLLPDMTAEETLELAERLRSLIAHTLFETAKGKLAITVSLGVAEKRADDNIDSLLQRADEALYKAKESGRNCVQVS